MANDIKVVQAQLNDLTAAFDRLLGRMSDMDLDKLIKTEGTRAQLIEMKTTLDDVYGAEKRVFDKFTEAIKLNNRRAASIKREIDALKERNEISDDFVKALEEETELTEEQLKELKKLGVQGEKDMARMVELIKQKKKLNDIDDKLKDQRAEEMKTGSIANLLKDKQSIKTKMLTSASKALGVTVGQLIGIYEMVKMGAEAYMFVLNKLISVHQRVWNWQNQLQKAMSSLAMRFGASTDAIVAMRKEGLNQLMNRGGLGDLGFSLEEITQKLADFQEQLMFTNKMTQAQAAEMIKLGISAGMTASEIGALTKNFAMMGLSEKDTKNFTLDIIYAAREAGVSARAMAQQFQGAGKSLLLWAGPAGQKMMIETAKHLAKMGVELGKIKGFVDMTDTFDSTAEAAAKLNTVFGLQLNALELFAEEDPGKRFAMVNDQMKIMGLNIDNMSRREKKFLAQTLQISEEELNAMLTKAAAQDAVTAGIQKELTVAEKRAEAQKMYEESLDRSKTMLMAEHQLTAKLNELATDALEPLYRGFGYGGNLQKGMTLIDGYINSWDSAIKAFKKNLDASGFAEAMFSVGVSFGKIWDQTMELFKSPAMADFVTGIMQTFSFVSRIVAALWPVVTFMVRSLGQVVGLIGQMFSLAESVLGPLWDVIGKTLNIAGQVFTDILAVIKGGIDMITNTLKELAGWVWKNIIQPVLEWTGFAKKDEPAKREAAATTAAAGGESSLAAKLGMGAQDGGMRGTEQKDATDRIVGPAARGFEGAIMGTADAIEARASGGPIKAGKTYRVGERGPEMMMSKGAAEIFSAADTEAILKMVTAFSGLAKALGSVPMTVPGISDTQVKGTAEAKPAEKKKEPEAQDNLELFMTRVVEQTTSSIMNLTNQSNAAPAPGTKNATSQATVTEQPFIVQVFLDGEQIQDKMYKRNLRSIS